MRLLLDTHSFLWFLEANPRLSAKAQSLIHDGANEVYLSVASLWEIAIKISLGKFQLAVPFREFAETQLSTNEISVLGITVGHIVEVAGLTFHHRDPFDRLLIAQAMIETMPIISADSAFDAYGVTRLW
jgi:PIN domain nuclease of toxin-antitoxin system